MKFTYSQLIPVSNPAPSPAGGYGYGYGYAPYYGGYYWGK